MKSSGILNSRLRFVQRWPLYVLPFICILTIIVLLLNRDAGIAVFAFLCVYGGFSVWWLLYWSKRIMREVVDFATTFDRVQNKQIDELSLPYTLISEKGEYIWMNQAFGRISDDETLYQHHIFQLFPELQNRLPEPGEVRIENIHFNDITYRAEMHSIVDGQHMIAVSLFDETELLDALSEIEEQKQVIGQIYVDNFEEVMQSTETVRQSLLAAFIERKITRYFAAYDGVIRKLDKDKFLLIMKKRDLLRAQEDRFSLLEDVKTVNIGNETAVTLSIGIGVDGDTLSINGEYSRKAIDLCLARGGDQAIVHTPDGSKFYGGKSQQQDKNTRVKARVKAQALREILMTKDQVMVMGHKLSDIDSVGAAIGIVRAAKTLGKNAHIVLDTITSSVRPLIQKFMDSHDYPEDLFITGERALHLIDNQTVVVVVDVNKPSYTECPGLLNHASSIVVLDHHRQGSEVIEHATLSYIEPYASSACEMVAEILQYIADNVKLRPLEAEAIYAGIVIDTNNFVNKTGVRTFEAAAYLRRCGADMTRVRKLFREKMENFQAKAETILTVELFRDFAFGVCPAEGIESPTIVGAQAANELLDIVGVKASIIFTQFNDQIYISARSIDEVNVQLIMERLGGGGHLSTAGAQLKGCSIEEAKELVKETILHMMDEGAL